MIAVDTNVVVRLLTGDDPEQSERTRALFRRSRVFIPGSVMLESKWVLRYAYGFEPGAICGAFRRLLGLPNIRVEEQCAISQAIEWHARGLDLVDALHLSASQSLAGFYSFDEKLRRRSSGLGDCAVVRP